MTDFSAIQRAIDYSFNDLKLLELALTHSSYANERAAGQLACNERMEFLGDAVLSLVVSDHLYRKSPQLAEGQLSKMRALIVCEQSLAEQARELNIGDSVLLGRGEAGSGGRQRSSILADASEALIAAIYLDGGIVEARRFILRQFADTIKQAVAGKLFSDYKTALQEVVQAQGLAEVVYRIVRESGPDHEKEFEAEVTIAGRLAGSGVGKSKKLAEQAAAQLAMVDYMED